LVTEEGKDTRYEIKRFEVDIGEMLLIGRLRVNPHPKDYTLQTDEMSTFKTSETERIYIKVLSAQLWKKKQISDRSSTPWKFIS
jgi:hypothetical protein